MRKSDLFIGHINFSSSFEATGEHFVRLVEGLQERGVTQHVLVRNATLAERLSCIDDVVVGPLVRSAVMACCHMPQLDIVHIHDMAAGQAGLLLVLTRSMPFVLTHRGDLDGGTGALAQAIYRRASRIICSDDSEVSILRHLEPTLRIEIIPEIERSGSVDAHLRVYQNSQRMPTAGSNGIQ
ncbi:MAG: glycosyltransferase [Gammaproteobacteria bacterium]|nr:glycosyltransferase [Gammaproteobacteria bacterium]